MHAEATTDIAVADNITLIHDKPQPVESAQLAGLRYIADTMPGIRRKRNGASIRYVGPDDKPVHDDATLQRIKSLALPPAWQDVWIAPIANGHLQATGRDAKGRKQYRYHPKWREVRDETKYTRMIAFGEALPHLREQVMRDLALPELPRDKVLATVVQLLDTTMIRVGNEEYARENKSFGLTTLRHRHVDVTGTRLRFHFRGKSGKDHSIEVRDRRLARIVKRCQDLPGHELFQYIDDDGQRHSVESADVNAYIQAISGHDFTAKDFRTWGGTVIASQALRSLGACTSEAQAKHNIVDAIKQAADHLGNTPAICRKCYVHPSVLTAYLDNAPFFCADWHDTTITAPPAGLHAHEADVLTFLRQLETQAHS